MKKKNCSLYENFSTRDKLFRDDLDLVGICWCMFSLSFRKCQR